VVNVTLELMLWATEIKVRAERRTGELLKVMPKNVGAKGSKVTGTKQVPLTDCTPTLHDLKISKKDSAAWQQLAALSEAEFERRLARAAGQAHTLTTDSIS
jgi:hypothetical protein